MCSQGSVVILNPRGTVNLTFTHGDITRTVHGRWVVGDNAETFASHLRTIEITFIHIFPSSFIRLSGEVNATNTVSQERTMLSVLQVVSTSCLTALLFLTTHHVVSGMAVKNVAVGDQCAVFGVGVLGTSLCKQLLEDTDMKRIVGITKSTTRHDEIMKEIGSGSDKDPSRLELTTKFGDEKFPNVVFCAPPSGFDDYPKAVEDAIANLWDGTGVFAFTSSGSV